MSYLTNPYRGAGLPPGSLPGLTRRVSDDPAPVLALLAECPAHGETPLVAAPKLAAEFGFSDLLLKDERTRMGLGAFKALGAVYALAKRASETGSADMANALAGQCFTAATAGNHGLSIAAGARIFGARAVIFIAETVPESFAERLRGKGAEVVRAGADYAASLHAAEAAAEENGWILLSDTSWPGYEDLPRDVMEGYLVLAEEVTQQMAPPSHIFLQAGVGGLAAAAAARFRAVWGDQVQIIVVEPEFAPAIRASIAAGRPVTAPGPVSSMGRLDCKDPSWLALEALARDADAIMTVTEDEADQAVRALAGNGMATSPSGAAGLAGAMVAARRGLMGADAKVLAIISEGAS